MLPRFLPFFPKKIMFYVSPLVDYSTSIRKRPPCGPSYNGRKPFFIYGILILFEQNIEQQALFSQDSIKY